MTDIVWKDVPVKPEVQGGWCHVSSFSNLHAGMKTTSGGHLAEILSVVLGGLICTSLPTHYE